MVLLLLPFRGHLYNITEMSFEHSSSECLNPMPKRSGVYKKVLAGATKYATAALMNQIVPGSGTAAKTAITGYKFGKKLFKKRRVSPVMPSQFRSGRKAKGRYRTTGYYSGKFPKGKSTATKLNVYSNKGIVSTTEVNGTCSDPDCVYISHSSVDHYRVVQVLVYALVRKLFTKCGYSITNITEPLGHISLSDAKDWQVDLTQIDGTTGIETVTVSHTTVAASSVTSIGDALRVFFMGAGQGAFLDGGNTVVDVKLHRLILYNQDFNVSRQPVFECLLNLEDEIMCLYGESDLKIQNRTLSASGSSEVHDVSNNPLIGRSYRFKTIPKMRDKSNFLLNAMPTNQGVQLARAAQLSTTMREPPLPTLFSNCSASAKINLQPGSIKKSKVIFKKNMNILTFLRSLRIAFGATPTANNYYSMFPCEMFALEDIINVNASQNISIAYESNRTLAVYFKTHKKALGLTQFQALSFNNNPA